MDVEVSEEDKEGSSIAYEGVVHPLREVAVNVEGVYSMDDTQRELQLCRGRGERERVHIKDRGLCCHMFCWHTDTIYSSSLKNHYTP